MKKILFNNEVISILVDLQDAKEGLDFFSTDNDFIQVGSWNYKKGKVLPLHFHNKFERTSERTAECVFVLSGKVECKLYSEEGEFIETVLIESGQLIIQLSQAHEYTILEDSIVLEVKNGPYFGPEKDRTRIEKI
jgi:cupin fold WbuC family metalloprotein